MDFYELSFEKDISEMTEEEAKETLEDFQEKHEENLKAAEEVADFEEQIEAKEDEIAEFKDQYVSNLADRVPLNEDELGNFSLRRLAEMDEETTEFEQEAEAEEEEEEAPEAPAFSEDKPSKAGDFSADKYDDATERAKSRLSGIAGLSFD